jgi:hypothetical protein
VPKIMMTMTGTTMKKETAPKVISIVIMTALLPRAYVIKAGIYKKNLMERLLYFKKFFFSSKLSYFDRK